MPASSAQGQLSKKDYKELLVTLDRHLKSLTTSEDEEYVLLEDDDMTRDDNKHDDARQTTISVSTTTDWTSKVLSDPKNRLALSALSSHDIPSVLTNQDVVLNTPHTFNIGISLEAKPITNQRSSGRCWLFASTNVFRNALIKSYNLKEFELSQAWLFFWDKLEKANWFLESVIDLVRDGKSHDERLMSEILKAPVNDGGQWDMVSALVKKYGLVPQSLYPDRFSAMNSSLMGHLITTKLREDSLKLKQIFNDHEPKSATSLSTKLANAKALMLTEIHRILTLMLGPPPAPDKKFTWSYYTTDGKFHTESDHTPLTFAAQLSEIGSRLANNGTDVHRLFSLVHDPRNEYYSLLTVDRLGNVLSSSKNDSGYPIFRQVTYVNVPVDVIKKACIAMLKEDHPIFFGCDVGKSSSTSLGLMGTGLIDYELGFNVSLGMNKADRLRVGESAMTHAMVLSAVHVETVEVEDAASGKKIRQEQSVRWRVENSWGESAGEKGYFVMSDDWFSEWVYQAVVDPRYVDSKVTDVLEQDPVVLPFWDPMGALA